MSSLIYYNFIKDHHFKQVCNPIRTDIGWVYTIQVCSGAPAPKPKRRRWYGIPYLKIPLGPLWELRTRKKSISIHINIYMEKSLKQREQLEGYLRDKLLWWYENSKYDYPKEKKKDE